MERTRLNELQQKARGREERRQKIANHQRHNNERRNRLEQSKNEIDGLEQIQEIDFTKYGVPIETDKDIESIKALSDVDAEDALRNFPSKSDLEVRLKAYNEHNTRLQSLLESLRERSSELEGKYRKVVSMCTRTPEAEVDDMLGQLLEAVTSEQSRASDMGRVREFLRRVEDTET